jgi:NAD(P)-dependent dehydrogenase (short-subunit alcohol dehydrogenase family)
MNRTLEGSVAVVTGASRGAGRAIAHVLGERGATVYVTGRSVRGGGPTPDGMPGTIDDTADEVTERGGRGIAVRCDHAVDAEVAALFERVRAEQDGRLDLLVNNAWGGYEGHLTGLPRDPFWKQDPGFWDSMFTAGVRAALTASRLAAPLLVERGRGLVIHTVAWMGGAYLGHLYYDLAKGAIVRMAFGMAHELRAHGVAVVALTPGFMRTERVMAAHAAYPFPLDRTESPEYLGRAVAALAADPEVMRWSGQVLDVGDLAREYGFTDIDGTRPAPFRMPAAAVES